MKDTDSDRNVFFASLHLPFVFLPLSDRVYSHIPDTHTSLLTAIAVSLPLTLFSKYQAYSGPLHLYISDAVWILEAVLISTRGDIYCVLCQVIALITWLVLHTWTESDVKLSGDELTQPVTAPPASVWVDRHHRYSRNSHHQKPLRHVAKALHCDDSSLQYNTTTILF